MIGQDISGKFRLDIVRYDYFSLGQVTSG